jgi:hypothetical protein
MINFAVEAVIAHAVFQLRYTVKSAPAGLTRVRFIAGVNRESCPHAHVQLGKCETV